MRGRKFVCDDLGHAIQIVQDVVVPKAQDSITDTFEKFGSARISEVLGMLPAVRFDDKPLLLTHEVGDEWSDRLLAAELRAFDLPFAQNGPEFALRIGHFAAQAPSLRQCFPRVARHALTLPPLRGSLPLPRGERGLGVACRLHPAPQT